MNQFYVDHVITTLAAILLPIESRELFLQQVSINLVSVIIVALCMSTLNFNILNNFQIEAVQEDSNVWVMVDSDGEDGEDNALPRTALKENDLIALLNQIPFSDLYRQVS